MSPKASASPVVESQAPLHTAVAPQVHEGKLGGATVVEASMQQVHHLVRRGAETDLPIWHGLADSIANDALKLDVHTASSTLPTFSSAIELSDKRRGILRVAAATQPDETMRLVWAGFDEMNSDSMPFSRLLRATEQGWLNGTAVEAASLRQLGRLVRRSPEDQYLRHLVDALSDGQLIPSLDNQPGQPQQFGTIVTRPDGSRDAIGVVAKLRNSTMHVSGYFLTTSSGRVLNREADDVKAELVRLQASVVRAGFNPGIQRAYADTARFFNHWMSKTGRGCVLDVNGNVPELLEAFLAYVGKRSYFGLNANCVLQALDGHAVNAAPQPRTVDPKFPTWMQNPLGLSEEEHFTIDFQLGANEIRARLQISWEPLLELFDRATVLRFAANATAQCALMDLIEVTPALRRAGYSEKGIDRIANRASAASLIRAVGAALPYIDTGRITLKELRAAAESLDKPVNAVKALSQRAAQAPRSVTDTRPSNAQASSLPHLGTRGPKAKKSGAPTAKLPTIEPETPQGTLAGYAIVEASMQQLQQLIVSGLGKERPIWSALAASMANDDMEAELEDPLTRLTRFTSGLTLSDGWNGVVHVSAAVQPDDTRRLVSAGFQEVGGEPTDRRLTSNRVGWLNGTAVDDGSMRQLSRLELGPEMERDEPKRRQLGLITSLVSNGQLHPSSTDQPGKPRQFELEITLPDSSKDVVGVTANLTANSTLQLSAVTLSRSSEPRALNPEAADVKARLQTLQASVAEADLGTDTEQAYADTARFVNHWMNKTGRGCVLDVRGNVPELLAAIYAYVGKASYYGSNAECVLRALDGEPVITAPRPRTIDPKRRHWMADPLGLTDAESALLGIYGGFRSPRAIEMRFEKLLELFDRAAVLRYAAHFGVTATLDALIEVTSDFRDAGFTEKEIDLAANRESAGPVLRGMHSALPLLRQRIVSRARIMAVVKQKPTAIQALKDLVPLAGQT